MEDLEDIKLGKLFACLTRKHKLNSLEEEEIYLCKDVRAGC